MRIICIIFIPLKYAFCLKSFDIEFAFTHISGSTRFFKVGIDTLWLFGNECSANITKISPKCYKQKD